MSNMVTVSGEVRKPGHYPLMPGITVCQIVEMAGGFTDYATGIIVMRGGQRVVFVTGRAWQNQTDTWNIQLRDKDAVFIRHTD